MLYVSLSKGPGPYIYIYIHTCIYKLFLYIIYMLYVSLSKGPGGCIYEYGVHMLHSESIYAGVYILDENIG